MIDNNELPCVDKIAFETKKAAITGATVADFQHSVKLKPYRCQYCNLWHLSSVS